MISFNKQDVERIRRMAKAEPKYLEGLLEEVKDVMNKIYVQPTALATW